MRNEIFQQIQENKRRFYQEISRQNSAPVKAIQSVHDEVNIEDSEPAVPPLFDFSGSNMVLKHLKQKSQQWTQVGFKILKAKIGLLSISMSSFLKSSVGKTITGANEWRSKYASKLEKIENQAFYFILVFFGEESALELASPKLKVKLQNLSNFAVSHSLSFLILFKQLENRVPQRNKKLFGFFKPALLVVQQNNRLSVINTLDEIRKALKNSINKSVLFVAKPLNYLAVLSILSFVKRL